MVKVEQFFGWPGFKDGIPVVAGAKDALDRLSATGRFEFVLVTSRQSHLEELTRKWLDKHFPGACGTCHDHVPTALLGVALALRVVGCLDAVACVLARGAGLFSNVVLGNHYGEGVRRCVPSARGMRMCP